MKETRFEKKYRACYDCLSDVSTIIQEAAKAANLDDKSTYQVETAVDEACTNIIEHAYGGENQGDITLECVSLPGTLTVKLIDTGKKFDPDAVVAPDLNSALYERQDHGLGLFFIRRWMDSVHFDFSPSQGNTLIMVKKARGTL